MHDHDHEEHEHHHHHADIPADGSPDELATCPVMHIPVNKQEAEDSGLKRTYNGKEYYLCCHNCAEEFDADPEHYAK